jgi:hypothetical protein
MPRAAWGIAVILVAGGAIAPALAQPVAGYPVSGNLPPEPVYSSLPPISAEPVRPANNLPPILGAPVLPARIQTASDRGAYIQGSADPNLAVSPVLNYQSPPPPPPPPPPQPSFSSPPTTGVAGPGAVPSVAPANSDPAIASQTTDPIDFLFARSNKRKEDRSSSDKFGDDIGDKLGDALGKRNDWFRSDHAFDGFISPVTNPFLFEDPRSLTEARPIFLFQKIPGGEADFHGGNIFYFGTQLRLAITDRLSFVINKFGLEAFEPGSDSQYGHYTGFAEFWLGPKYTFIRGESTGTLMAGGLQFQIPTGSHGNFQNTGSLSLVPWVSFAQSFLRDFSLGGFNFMASTGYSFSVNNERSDYYYLSAHLDMNVLNYNHFFPLVEMNWFFNTTNGTSTPVRSEGQDLNNFGGQAKGDGLLTIAIGARYKFNECYQLGAAFEAPIAGNRQVDQYRFTLDFIFRY